MSEYIAETFMHAGYRVQIIADQDAQSPDDWDSDEDGLFIVTSHNRYFERLFNGTDAQGMIEDKEFCKRYWIFPLQAYIHSGVALSLTKDGYPFNDRWDSGQIGFVFVAKSEARYRTRDCKRRPSAWAMAKGLVETWNQYLSGDVWGYVISAVSVADGDEDLDELSESQLSDLDEDRAIDSLWGMYGIEYCRTEAKTEAERARKQASGIPVSHFDVIPSCMTADRTADNA